MLTEQRFADYVPGAPTRLKVCHLITKLDVGGAQETVLALARGIDRERFDIAVAAGPEVGPDGDLWDAFERSGVGVTCLPALRRGVGLHDVVALRQIVRWFRAERPAIVHTH